jgi:ubiquitin C-terminal hydrolase
MSIFRWPKILVIHIKRFYNSSSRREKLSTTVNIPSVLDMSPYGPRSNHESKKTSTKYRLYGISHHSGSLYGGHYVAEAMNLEDGQCMIVMIVAAQNPTQVMTKEAPQHTCFFM